jgi:hypothetical protein
MSFARLKKLIESEEFGNVSSPAIPGFKIDDFLLSKKEVVVNLLMMENNLPREEAEFMVYGLRDKVKEQRENLEELKDEVGNSTNDLSVSDEAKKKFRRKSVESLDNLENLADTNLKRIRIRQTIDSELDALETEDGGILLDDRSPLFQRAAEILKTLRVKINLFFRKVKEIGIDIWTHTTAIATTIPGAILMLAPFAFNLPGFITQLMQMISSLINLVSRVADIGEVFPFFTLIAFAVPEEKIDAISDIILKTYNAIIRPFDGLRRRIDAFISRCIELIKERKNSDRRAAKRITSRLRKLKYLRWSVSNGRYFVNGVDSVAIDEDDRDEVEEILENWEVFDLGNKRIAVKRRRYKDENGVELDIDDVLNNIDALDEVSRNIEQIVIGADSITRIYNAEFSDGRRLYGLSRLEVEELGQIYNVIYSPNSRYSFPRN